MKIISFLGVYSFPFRIETQCIPHIDLVTVAAVLIASRCYGGSLPEFYRLAYSDGEDPCHSRVV